MKNVLNYYYNLIPTSIHQINKEYKCYINDSEYLLVEYNDSLDKLEDIYKLSMYMLNMQIPCHQIILNINNSIVTYINNIPYILMKIYVSSQSINLKNILMFQNFVVDSSNFKYLISNEWYNMWTKKIDYLEYQISQIGKKYPIIRDSFNYYVGLAENSISLLSELGGYKDNFFISHKRISFNENIKELYNPLNLIIDSKSRDVSEYIKSKFFFDKYSIYDAINDIRLANLNGKQYLLFFSRLLFPSYYFDAYEDIISNKKDEKIINRIVLKSNEYSFFLKEIWEELNKYYKIPEIDWLIKKM